MTRSCNNIKNDQVSHLSFNSNEMKREAKSLAVYLYLGEKNYTT